MPVLIAVIIEDMAALCGVDFVDKSGKPGVFSLPVHLYAPVHHTHTHSHTHTHTHTCSALLYTFTRLSQA